MRILLIVLLFLVLTYFFYNNENKSTDFVFEKYEKELDGELKSGRIINSKQSMPPFEELLEEAEIASVDKDLVDELESGSVINSKKNIHSFEELLEEAFRINKLEDTSLKKGYLVEIESHIKNYINDTKNHKEILEKIYNEGESNENKKYLISIFGSMATTETTKSLFQLSRDIYDYELMDHIGITIVELGDIIKYENLIDEIYPLMEEFYFENEYNENYSNYILSSIANTGGKEAIYTFRKILTDPNHNFASKKFIINLEKKFTLNSVELLEEGLYHTNNDVIDFSLKSLSSIDAPETVDALINWGGKFTEEVNIGLLESSITSLLTESPHLKENFMKKINDAEFDNYILKRRLESLIISF